MAYVTEKPKGKGGGHPAILIIVAVLIILLIGGCPEAAAAAAGSPVVVAVERYYSGSTTEVLSHPDVAWAKTYHDGRAEDVLLVDGGFVVTGSTASAATDASDVFLLKVDKNGARAWNTAYDVGEIDGGADVAATEDGYIIAGDTYTRGSGWQVCLIKTAADGTSAWSGLADADDSGSHGLGILPMASGGYLTTGYAESGLDKAVYVFRELPSGSVMSSWTLDSGGMDLCTAALADGDGYLLAGTYEDCLALYQTDRLGKLVSLRIYRNVSGTCTGIIKTGDDYVLTGYGRNGSWDDAFLAKIAGNGTFLWAKDYGETRSHECSYGLVPVRDGFVFAGYRDTGDDRDIYLVKTDPEGSLVREWVYRDAPVTEIKAITLTTEGDFLLAGSRQSGSDAPKVFLLQVKESAFEHDTLPGLSGITPANDSVLGGLQIDEADNGIRRADSLGGMEVDDGDINADGMINSLDALLALLRARNGSSGQAPEANASDVLKMASMSSLGSPLVRPVAIFNVSYDEATFEYTFNAAGSTGTDLTCEWGFGDDSYGSGVLTTHLYGATGRYNVTLLVTDSYGRTSRMSKTVEVNMIGYLCSRPDFFRTEANFTVRGVVGRPAGTMFFDGSSSTGANLTFEWNFGDGTKGAGQTVSHRYLRTGTYTVILTVHDLGGVNDSKKGTVRITSVSGIAGRSLSGETGIRTSLDVVQADFIFDKLVDGAEGELLLNASASHGAGLTYAWDFDDGATGTGVVTRHTFAIPGEYNVTLTVTDVDGARDSAIRHLSLGVSGPAEVVARFVAEPLNGTVPLTVKFNAYESADPFAPPEYAWDYGDGATGTGMITTHVYEAAGSYTVTLTVSDAGGHSATASKVVVAKSAATPTLPLFHMVTATPAPTLPQFHLVTPTPTGKPLALNKAPVALFNYTYKKPVLNLTAAKSSDSDGKIVKYEWSMRNAKSGVVTDLGAGVSVKKTMTQAGTYVVSLKVTDDDKATDTYDETIPITSV